MSIISNSVANLDKGKAFEAWVETGSVVKARNHLTVQGIINPNTGKPFSPFSVWYSSWCWVLEHLEEARPIFEKEQQGEYSDEEWAEKMIRRAIDLYLQRSSKSRFMNWIKKNRFEKYDYMYSEAFSTEFARDV